MLCNPASSYIGRAWDNYREPDLPDAGSFSVFTSSFLGKCLKLYPLALINRCTSLCPFRIPLITTYAIKWVRSSLGWPQNFWHRMS